MKKNISIFVYALIFSVFLWVFLFFTINILTIFYPGIDSITNIIDLDLAQVIIELLLIPLVLISFLITKKGYDDSQRKSVLELVWADGSENQNNKIISVREDENSIYIPKIILFNKGNSLSLHYKIILTFPINISAGHVRSQKWKIETRIENQNYQQFSYTNPESNPIYPDEMVTFDPGEIKIQQVRGRDKIKINYEIYSESGKKEIGNLILINEGPK